MVIDQVFENPTVQQVIFQIRFSNLFFIENKIGDIQVKIMKEFPESSLIFQRQLVISDLGDKGKITPDNNSEQGFANKVWQFKSNKGYLLNISNSTLDIVSTLHKTYNNITAEHRFRDIIKLAVDTFLEITGVQIVKRVGLRYIDRCPISKKNNSSFTRWYNTSFPIKRFRLEDAEAMKFETIVRRGDYGLRYCESLDTKDGLHLILDFDGFSNEVESLNYLSVLDDLHGLISNEFEHTIKAPVYEYMKRKKQ
jgi:uncharacterized protein (TIGR04255 family)